MSMGAAAQKEHTTICFCLSAKMKLKMVQSKSDGSSLNVSYSLVLSMLTEV